MNLFFTYVPEELRGRVGGIQSSLNSLFEIIPFVLGMVYSDVDKYWIVMLLSYISVGIALHALLRCGVRSQDHQYSTVELRVPKSMLGPKFDAYIKADGIVHVHREMERERLRLSAE